MALNFENKIDEWQNEGAEPSSELKENGFTAGYKPPASIFNWFWNKVTNCINEIQNLLLIHLGKLTQETYTDDNGNKYTDVNGMHIRTDNGIYCGAGVFVLDEDPCADGENITEDTMNGHILGGINSTGKGTFQQLNVNKSSSFKEQINAKDVVYTQKYFMTDQSKLTEQAVEISGANGAIFVDNSSNSESDGSRTLIVGTYHDTPEKDDSGKPTTLPDAGIRARVESDTTDDEGNAVQRGSYVDVYGDNIVCRTEGAAIKASIVKAVDGLEIGGISITTLLTGLVPANYIIASSDTPDELKKHANYVCERFDEDSGSYTSGIRFAIENGLTALGATGGKIIILPGTYTEAYTIGITADNVTIEGFGDATQLKSEDATSWGITISGNHNRLRNFSYTHDTSSGKHNSLILEGNFNIIEGVTLIQTMNSPVIDVESGAYGNVIMNCYLLTTTSNDEECIIANYSGGYLSIINCFAFGLENENQTHTYYSVSSDWFFVTTCNLTQTETEPS